MKNRCFTLVEILIVVCVLGILAYIIIPRFREVQRETERRALLNKLSYAQKIIVTPDPNGPGCQIEYWERGSSEPNEIQDVPSWQLIPFDLMKEMGFEEELLDASELEKKVWIRSDKKESPKGKAPKKTEGG